MKMREGTRQTGADLCRPTVLLQTPFYPAGTVRRLAGWPQGNSMTVTEKQDITEIPFVGQLPFCSLVCVSKTGQKNGTECSCILTDISEEEHVWKCSEREFLS